MSSGRLFDGFISWLLYTSLFAACCATALSMATEQLLIGYPLTVAAPLHVFIFCSTLLIYNTHSLMKRPLPGLAGRYTWSQNYRRWHWLFFSVGIVGCLFVLLQLPFRIWLWSGVSGLLAFAYSLPLLPFKSVRYIRQVGWAKIIVLAGVWTIVTVIMPLVYHHLPVAEHLLLIAMRFVFIFVLCLAFDIRDMATDKEAGIATLPNVMGRKNSYSLIDVLLLLYLVMGSLAQFYAPAVPHILAVFLIVLLTRIVVHYAGKYSSDRKYLGLVDGMMLVQAAFIMLGI